MLVSAAAGSGKTAALVERIIRIVVDDKVDVNKLIVVTFTRAAAGEMKDRLRQGFYDVIGNLNKEDDPDQNLIERIERQLTLLNTAQITTIDSFCQYIIKNYFYAVPGLDPGFRIIEDEEGAILLKDTMNEVLEKRYTRFKENPEDKENVVFGELTEFISSWKNDDAVLDTVIRLYKKSRTTTNPIGWLDSVANVYKSIEYTDWMRNAALDICGEVEDLLKAAVYARKVLAGYEELLHWSDIIESDIVMLKNLLTFDNKEDPDYIPTLKEVYENFARHNALGGFSDWRGGPKLKDEELKSLKDTAKSARDMYAGYKGRIKGIWDNFLSTDKVSRMLKLYYSGKGMEYDDPEDIEAYMVDCITMLSPYVDVLVSLAKELGEDFSAAKKEMGVVDFSDLEYMALDILYDTDQDGNSVRSDIAGSLENYYEGIMIDEYQDSNYLQEYILMAVAGDKKDVFMVGDVKQSIYSFRSAVPALFMDKQDAYDPEEIYIDKPEEDRKDKDICVVLDRNYRSRRNVLESVNELFTGLMTRDFGRIDYDEKASLKYGGVYDRIDGILDKEGNPTGISTEETDKLYNTELILIDSSRNFTLLPSDARGKAAKKKMQEERFSKIELEARAIGERIHELMDENNPFMISDEDENKNPIKRKLKLGDIAVLSRKNLADSVCKVLEEMGIPTVSETKTGFLGRTEIATVLNFLRIIDNPKQDIPLVSVMHSKFFDFNENELACFRIMNGQYDSFYERVEAYASDEGNDELREKARHFIDDIVRLREEVLYKNLYDLLFSLYTEYDYYDLAATSSDGEARKANLDLLLTKARSFAEKGNSSPLDFIHYIENVEEQNVEMGEASMHNEDAVKIMTIHKSKGLEFPVVFVCHLDKEFNYQDTTGTIAVDGEAGIGISLFDTLTKTKAGWLYEYYMKSKMVMDIKEEEQRILYVALTRAREKLFMVGCVKFEISEPTKEKNKDPEAAVRVLYRDKILDLEKKFGLLRDIGIPDKRGSTHQNWVLTAVSRRSSFHKAITEFAEQYHDKGLALCEEREYMAPYVHVVDDKPLGIDMTFMSYEHIIDKKAELSKRMDEEALADMDIVGDKPLEEEQYIYPYSNPMGYPSKVSVSRLKESEEEVTALPKKKRRVKDEAVSAADLGTAYHTVMQKMNFSRIWEYMTPDKADAYMDELCERGFIPEKVRKAMDGRRTAEFVASISNDDIILRMTYADQTGRLWREQPFMKEYLSKELPNGIIPDEFRLKGEGGSIADGSDDKHTTLVQGVIDAFFVEDDDRAVIIDYKTDGMTLEDTEGLAKELVKRHKAQFDYYTDAIESLLGVKVKERYICSLTLGEFIPV